MVSFRRASTLDRFSRDQEGTAGFFKRLSFAGVKIVTVSEGEIGDLHVGLKGTMNALYLKDLADKTRRGLRGRVEAGRSGGGLCYGYRVVRVLEGDARGKREIDPAQAEIVRRIFRAYRSGVSPKAIAKALNAEGVRGPHGASWSPSTIYGNASRGVGVLNNELYVGRMVWNRQRFVKDPDTGKRQARLNPRTEWITTSVPELRIIEDDMWDAVKTRQASTRKAASVGLVRARRPKYLFSGLTRCGECGAGFTLSSRNRLACFNATARGTCTNHRHITRQEVEARVLRAIRERLFEPGAFAAFCDGFAAEMEADRKERLAQCATARRELANVERNIKKVIESIKQGVPGDMLKDEATALQNRKLALQAALADPPAPALHPDMATLFRLKVTTLAAGLEKDEFRDEARETLRGFLDHIVIPPGDGLLRVVGNFGKMLDAAQSSGSRAAVGQNGCGGGI